MGGGDADHRGTERDRRSFSARTLSGATWARSIAGPVSCQTCESSAWNPGIFGPSSAQGGDYFQKQIAALAVRIAKENRDREGKEGSDKQNSLL
jgi:hypothetical protein